MKMKIKAALVALCLPGMAQAVTCRDDLFEEASYSICEVTPDEDLRLFLNGPEGPYASFAALVTGLEPTGLTLNFAMNAGMFDEELAPVGLYIENFLQKHRIVTSDGPGNFGLLPNGVFCVGNGFAVIESRSFKAAPPACRYATQSGPMLVIDGALHPGFARDSDSYNYRNGVGVAEDGRAIFVISNDAVNFHAFARYFRDIVGVKNALFLDGSVSRLYAPELDRDDMGFPIGPIVGVVTAKD